MKKESSPHSHGWLVGILGLIIGVSLMVVFPKFQMVAGIIILMALFHLIGAVVVLGSLYSFAPKTFGRLIARFRKPPAADELDYGWSLGALYGGWLMSLTLATVAFGMQLERPELWPIWFVLALFAVSFFIGGLLMRTSKHKGWATLPMVDLLRSDQDLVLDAGCGAGRTTIAISRVLTSGSVVALDRFDAYYIDDGGRALLEHNLAVAGLTDRVRIERGDITGLSFEEATFDSAVSAHVIDHLGKGKQRGLAEIHRVLKPGGRFLMVVWVPGWVMFSVANVLCFFLTSKSTWRKWVREAGFTIRDEGLINGAWFMVLEKSL